jgi:hypothetical protein
VLEIFWISRTRHFVQLRTWWGSFQTWSQHMNDLWIEMCSVSHNLRRQIILLLEGLDNPGSPGHRSRVTLQAYRVTRALVPGHPSKCTCCVDTGQTGACHRSDQWPPIDTILVIFAFLFPRMCGCVPNLNPATWIGHYSTREPLKASNGMRE